MAVLAGIFAGVMMAMIFLPHSAIVLVFSRKFARSPGNDEATSRGAWPFMVVAGAAFLTWVILGVAAAVLFTVAQRVAPTHVAGIPSVAYLLGVVAVVLLAAPWVFILAPRLWRHAVIEFVVFVAIFGIQIPMTAGIG